MSRWHSLMYHISLFVLAQFAWFTLLGIWIYWYVSNYFIFQKAGEKVSPQLTAEATSSTALVSGLILLVIMMILMSLIFKYLYRQITLHKRYGNFIANVTHELKSPLASIQLLLETMDARDLEPELRKKFIARMLADIGRLDATVSSVLEISGLEQGGNPYRYTVNAADTVINGIVDEALARFTLPHAAVTVTGCSNATVVVDSDALQTVFNNLVDNTIKYSLGAPAITIRITADRKHVFIDYGDRGIGIPPRDRRKVFSKFYRGQARDIPDVTGVGLGLYRVQEIIRAHGGTVAITGNDPGQGTNFRITLPIYKAAKKRHTRKLLKTTVWYNDEPNNKN